MVVCVSVTLVATFPPVTFDNNVLLFSDAVVVSCV